MERESKCVTTKKKKISKAQNKAAGRKEQKSYLQKTMNKNGNSKSFPVSNYLICNRLNILI